MNRHSAVTAIAICIAPLVLFPAPAAAGDDYDPESGQWNGLSEFVAVADAAGLELTVVDRLDVGTLEPADAVVVVYPEAELPLPGLSSFLRDGGRVALLDDFGEGGELLRVYRIERTMTDLRDAVHLRANTSLPVAQPTAPHALTEGVSALVANHPTVLRHDDLDALFSFDETGRALVLAGAVGDGRLVAVGDASVVINNMLEFVGNRRFATNLLRYLEAGGGGRIFLVAGDAALVGRYGEPGADRPFYDLARWLRDAATADAPPAALLVGAGVIALILLVVAATALPRKSPYDGAKMFAPPSSSGGFIGRVGFFSRHRDDLYSPAMVYKFELEGELVRLLDITSGTALRDVMAALASRGLGDEELADARALLLELDTLRSGDELPQKPPRVSPARFRNLLTRGERVLSRLAAGGDPAV